MRMKIIATFVGIAMLLSCQEKPDSQMRYDALRKNAYYITRAIRVLELDMDSIQEEHYKSLCDSAEKYSKIADSIELIELYEGH